jgi:hypothetical protein
VIRIALRLGLLGLAVVAASGCKQGLNQRCQVQADCDDNLVCNEGTNTCTETTGTGLDATVPIDAPRDAPLDAAVLDAEMIDAH